MNALERKSTFALSTILTLRMLGLFMALPLFSLYALRMNNASPQLAGIALGIYGLTQAFFQIPLGTCSDYFGRKKVITFGLLLFISGSILVATSNSIQFAIIGRALQGAGAIGSTVIALMSDLIRDDQRSKAMAFAGMMIGTSFSVALVIGPALTPWIGFNGIFWLAAIFGIIAIFVLYRTVPDPDFIPTPANKYFLSNLKNALFYTSLPHLYFGIFILHVLFTATFMTLPIDLKNQLGFSENRQWIIYLSALIPGFLISIFFIVSAEKKQRMKIVFRAAILLIGLAEFCFSYFSAHLFLIIFALFLFFTGFSTLEAILPSLVSRLAPPTHKGSALGIYSCAQFSGIFVGGLAGGWLMGSYNTAAVYLASLFLGIVWIIITFSMKNSQNHRAFSSSN